MKIKKKIPNKISYIRKSDLVVFGAVFILMIILIMGISISVEHHKKTQLIRVQETMDVISESHKNRFENYVDQKVEVLQGLVSFTEINTMIPQKQSVFLKGRSEELGFHHLFVMDMDGYGHYFDDGVVKDQSEEIFYRDVMSHHVYITQPFYAEHAAFMTVCTSIFDGSKQKVGVLCGAIELKSLQSEFSESKAAYDGQMYLVDRDGRYISCSDMDKVYKQLKIYKTKDSELSLVKDAFVRKSDQKGTVVLDGVEYLTNVSYLADYDWAIIQCVNKSAIYGELQIVDVFKYASLVIAVVIVVCVIRIAMYLSKSQKRVNTDTLTGCNSRAATERLLDTLEKFTDVPITIAYMDLNKFKYINDTYGHDKGDEILCIFTNVLSKVFDKKGFVGRMGGDEFMIMFVNTSDEEVEKLCIQVKEQLIEESKKLSIDYTISASYGYETRPKGSKESLDSITVKADEKMYRYKEENR